MTDNEFVAQCRTEAYDRLLSERVKTHLYNRLVTSGRLDEHNAECREFGVDEAVAA